MTTLLLPAGFKPSNIWKSMGHKFRVKLAAQSAWRVPKSPPKEHPGKKFGQVEGAWIDDLVSTKKVIILCWKCQNKFDHKRSHYYKDRRFPHVVAKCDGCRTFMNSETKLYIHESFLGDPDGNSKAGHSWTPM